MQCPSNNSQLDEVVAYSEVHRVVLTNLEALREVGVFLEVLREVVVYLEARKEEEVYLEAHSLVNSEKCFLLIVWLLQEERLLISQLQDLCHLELHRNNKCNKWHKHPSKWHKLNHNYLEECRSLNKTSKCL